MTDELKTYNPQGRHVSSSVGRWVNYTGATHAQYRETRAQVFADFPGSYIVDGSDDWSAPPERRPQLFCDEPRVVERSDGNKKVGLGIGRPLAFYHSKTSGVTCSGIVISEEQYELLKVRYAETYGCNLTERCEVWAHPDMRL